MACFLAPAAEAVVVTVIKKKIEKKEQAQINESGTQMELHSSAKADNNLLSTKLGWLMNLLWGGSFLLLIEHIWHGEVSFAPPFITAMGNASDMAQMFNEIATVGTVMAFLVTTVWAIAVAALKVKEQNAQKEAE